MISLDINIPHLQIAPLVGNLEVGNLEGILNKVCFLFMEAYLSIMLPTKS